MERVVVYSKDNCPYCTSAVHLLNTRKIAFEEQKLGLDFTREQILEQFPTARTFPIITVDGFYIGGYTQLAERVNQEYSETKQLLNEG
jgi:glutaredoxin 3